MSTCKYQFCLHLYSRSLTILSEIEETFSHEAASQGSEEGKEKHDLPTLCDKKRPFMSSSTTFTAQKGYIKRLTVYFFLEITVSVYASKEYR